MLRGEPYNYGKDEILTTLDTMLQTAIFEFENRSAVYQALQRTRQGKGDFSDYLRRFNAAAEGYLFVIMRSWRSTRRSARCEGCASLSRSLNSRILALTSRELMLTF